jgi:hypothetical protein
MKVNKSLAAGLTCAAVLLVMGGAAYIVVTALIDRPGAQDEGPRP